MAARAKRSAAVVMGVALAAGPAIAQPAPAPAPVPEPTPSPEPALQTPPIEIHGFASEGAFVSTANDYIGPSSRGSLALFEAGINFSTQLDERLRVGFQLYGRKVGNFEDLPPRLDWAFLDYHWQSWLGLRAGIIKMPFGLYNEYADIDAARTAILMPQGVYSIRNRSALLAQTGFALYGVQPVGGAGELEYQAWLGTLDIPSNALEVVGARLDRTDTRYVTGAQVFWQPPVDGLRLGATFLRASLDFNLTLDPATVSALIAAGLVPADYDGALVISQRPDQLWIASAEYTRGDWILAAEYERSSKRQRSSLPDLIPTFEVESELFYAMARRRLSDLLEVGGYYSVSYADDDDRHGHDPTRFPNRFDAWQRDLTATVRLDVDDHWLWKVEGHFIDGTADLEQSLNPQRERYWGLFLVKTTVTF